jgi:hypothetical protein
MQYTHALPRMATLKVSSLQRLCTVRNSVPLPSLSWLPGYRQGFVALCCGAAAVGVGAAGDEVASGLGDGRSVLGLCTGVAAGDASVVSSSVSTSGLAVGGELETTAAGLKVGASAAAAAGLGDGGGAAAAGEGVA